MSCCLRDICLHMLLFNICSRLSYCYSLFVVCTDGSMILRIRLSGWKSTHTKMSLWSSRAQLGGGDVLAIVCLKSCPAVKFQRLQRKMSIKEAET